MSRRMDALEQLREQIRLAFPATQYFGPITPCDCDECSEIRDGLNHKQWDEVPQEFLDFTGNPTLLTPEAFVAFLPAYLLRALDDLNPHGAVLGLTVYSLTLCPEEWQVRRMFERIRLMTVAQVQAVRAFLKFAQENSGDPKWNRSEFAHALEKIWV